MLVAAERAVHAQPVIPARRPAYPQCPQVNLKAAE